MTRPLTGYEREIAILHAEANQSVELIEEFKGIANGYKQAIERVRALHKPFTYEKNGEIIVSDICDGCEKCWGCGEWGTQSDCPCNKYPCRTIQALEEAL
jgi:hypothetical protein